MEVLGKTGGKGFGFTFVILPTMGVTGITVCAVRKTMPSLPRIRRTLDRKSVV